MGNTVEKRLTLREPIAPYSRRAERKRRGPRSPLFWRNLKKAVLVLVATVAVTWLWDALSLPTFELQESEYSWILIPTIAATVFAVDKIFEAFEDEQKSQRIGKELQREEEFEREVFPFISEILRDIDNGDGHELTLPPRDWMIQDMAGKSADGAYWFSRYRNGKEYLHFSAVLAEEGSELVVAVSYPDGVQSNS